MVKRLRKKHIPSFYFKKVPKRQYAINELIGDPIIIEMKDHSIFAGILDDYIGRGFSIIDGKQCMKNECGEWLWHDRGLLQGIEDFFFIEIKNLYTPKNPNLDYEDMLTLMINPTYQPLNYVHCEWNETGKHSKNCDDDLHESLSLLYKTSHSIKNEIQRNEFKTAFKRVRRFILENGGKVP